MHSHPAKFSPQLIPIIARMLQGNRTILDPFAGVGGIFQISQYLPDALIQGTEIEPEWADQHPGVKVGNALALPFHESTFDAVATSPSYGNRMADQLLSTPRQRNTYADHLRRKVSSQSSCALQWGAAYRDFHVAAWQEVRRVLAPDGVFVLNIKDHIRTLSQSLADDYATAIQKMPSDKLQCRIYVTRWHIDTLKMLGFFVIERQDVMCRGNRQGQNGDARIPYESVIKFGVIK